MVYRGLSLVFDQYMAMERGFVLLNHATPLRIPVQRNP